MMDAYSLFSDTSSDVRGSDTIALQERLGLYQVFLKLYEHHRDLLDEILKLENSAAKYRSLLPYIQGVVEADRVYLVTNLFQGTTRAFHQPQKIWTIGRDRRSSIVFQDNRLSRRHAAIYYQPEQGFYLVDLDSTNGTFVNSEPVHRSVLLREGDRIRLGQLDFIFFLCHSHQVAPKVPPEIIKLLETKTSLVSPPLQAKEDSTQVTLPEEELFSGPEDTSLLRIPALLPREVIPTCPSGLSADQQANIFDRFSENQALSKD